jgi:hypothetical protein
MSACVTVFHAWAGRVPVFELLPFTGSTYLSSAKAGAARSEATSSERMAKRMAISLRETGL